MRLFYLILFSLATLPSDVQAQIGNTDFGARSKSLANSNSTLADEWSIFNNVGGISGVTSGTVFFGYDRFFALEGFDRVAVGAIQPVGFGNIGISAFRYGDELYNESILSASFGNKIGFVRLGLRANYLQIRIDEFGSSGTMFFDFGGIVEMFPTLSFGAYISNFTLSSLPNDSQTEVPVLMKLGLAYTPVPSVRLNLDIHKDIDYKPIVKAGLEYTFREQLFLRTGFNTDPFTGFCGIGVWLERFHIDYAIGANQYMGASHQATVSFTYQKNVRD